MYKPDAGRTDVTIQQLRLSGEDDDTLPALVSLPQIFPAAESLSLYFSERLSPSAVLIATLVLQRDQFYGRIKHLSLASTSPQGLSKHSSWPQGMPYWPIDLSGMQGLESLTFTGRAPQADVLSTVATTCTGLTSLVLGLKPEDPLVLPSGEQGSSLVTRPSAMHVISKMTSLRQLSLFLEDNSWDWDDEDAGPSAQLTALTSLTGLTELRLGGAAVSAEAVRVFLKAARRLRRVAFVFDAVSGKLHDRRDLALWKQMRHVELRLQGRLLESDLPLLVLGLRTNLVSLHLSDCSVSPYSVSALSSLASLTELCIGSWRPVGAPAAAEGTEVPAVRGALVGLLAGPLGERLEVLRMELSDASKEIYDDLPRLAETWAHGSLRVLHLAHASAYSLTSTAALASLAGLSSLRDLRVSIEGQACRDGSALRAAWLPPNLTCLELAGVHLPCGEEELVDPEKQHPHPQQLSQQLCMASPDHTNEHVGRESGGEAGEEGAEVPTGARGARQTRDSVKHRRMEAPRAAAAGAAAAAAGGSEPSGDVRCGHARLRNLQRLRLHSCRFGCCGHLEAALGPAVLPQLVSLELNDVGDLAEEHLSGLAALTGLTSLSVCALGHSSISSSSMAHVSGLVGLRRLRWHAGDSLDAPPHPAMLKPLRRLVSLDVSSGQWWRMSRWHVASALAEELPLCEVAVS
ncbi:hypothetical protein PLESTM_001927700 [Pleodorina starrii]|nr:hypothetical protein PLESTM_001927700 [Pleodorina starrii]